MFRPKRSAVSIIAAQAVVLLCLQAHAQLRILDYNVAASGSASSGPRSGMDSVLRAINAQNRPGFSKPIDIMLMQEAESVATTGQSYANLLNVITGGTTYLASTVDGSSTGSGRPIVVYNSAAVTLISEVGIGVVSSTTQPRQTMRYQFRPVGYDSSADLYVYNSHLKASTGSTNEARRNIETTTTRANADALGDGTNIIYVGDLNLYDSSEAAFQTLLAPGNGQAFDPINQIGSWSGNAVYKAFHTQSPATTAAYGGQVTGGMDDRFDFQLVTGEWLDGRGLDYVSGSYWAFGNTGTHNLNGAITTGSSAALQALLPGYTVAQSGTVLTLLSQVADHLPVVADYQLPAKMSASLASLPAKVIVGAAVSGTLTVSNSAPVSVVQGADRLDYGYVGSGGLNLTISPPKMCDDWWIEFGKNTTTVGKIPQPSNTMAFIGEDDPNANFNEHGWCHPALNTSTWIGKWIDLPPLWGGNAINISMVDGSAQALKILSPRLREWFQTHGHNSFEPAPYVAWRIMRQHTLPGAY